MPIDAGMIRTMLFAILFGTAFVGLLAIAGLSGFATTNNYSNPSDVLNPSSSLIQLSEYNFTDTWNRSLIWADTGGENFDVGGRNLAISHYVDFGFPHFTIGHKYGFGLLFVESMGWYNENEQLVSYQQYGHAHVNSEIIDNGYTITLNKTYNATFNKAQFKVRCAGLGSGSSKFEVIAFTIFNKTAYSEPSEAWYNDNLLLILGITPESSSHSIDIMSILTSLLTFNTYAVFGSTDTIAIILNGLIVVMMCVPSTIFIILFIKEILSNWL